MEIKYDENYKIFKGKKETGKHRIERKLLIYFLFYTFIMILFNKINCTKAFFLRFFCPLVPSKFLRLVILLECVHIKRFCSSYHLPVTMIKVVFETVLKKILRLRVVLCVLILVVSSDTLTEVQHQPQQQT